MKHCCYKKSNGKSCKRLTTGRSRHCWQHQEGGRPQDEKLAPVQKREVPQVSPTSRVFPANPREGRQVPRAGRPVPMYPYQQPTPRQPPQMYSTQGQPMYAYQPQQPVCPPCPPCGNKADIAKSLSKGFASFVQNAPQMLRRGAELAQNVKNIKVKH